MTPLRTAAAIALGLLTANTAQAADLADVDAYACGAKPPLKRAVSSAAGARAKKGRPHPLCHPGQSAVPVGRQTQDDLRSRRLHRDRALRRHGSEQPLGRHRRPLRPWRRIQQVEPDRGGRRRCQPQGARQDHPDGDRCGLSRRVRLLLSGQRHRAHPARRAAAPRREARPHRRLPPPIGIRRRDRPGRRLARDRHECRRDHPAGHARSRSRRWNGPAISP